MKKTLIALTAAALLSTAIAPISSIARERGEGPRAGHHRPGKNLNRLARILDLSEEQGVALQALNDSFKEEIQLIRAAMQENRDALKILADADPVNTDAIQQVADDQGDLFAQVVVLKTEKHIAVKALLTEEQLAKLEELRAAMEERRNSDDSEEEDELDA